MEYPTDANNAAVALEESPVEIQTIITTPQDVDNLQSKASEQIEEIDSSNPVAEPGKPASRATVNKEPPPANPLLNDPYEWDQCTITLVYALLPDQTVSVSIHNHKDEPIVKSFLASEILLPEKISGLTKTLQTIWPDNTVSATVVLLPQSADAKERAVVMSVRAGNDTPIVQTGVESDLCFPAQINVMLEELKSLLPARALKHIEKDARTKISPTSKTISKPALKTAVSAPATTNKSQLSLF